MNIADENIYHINEIMNQENDLDPSLYQSSGINNLALSSAANA